MESTSRDESRGHATKGTAGAVLTGAAALLCALALGCGSGDPAPAPSGRSMGAAPAAKQGNEAPVIHSVRITPPSPQPGQAVRAEVSASDPDGDAVDLHYAWRVAGQPMPDAGAELEPELLPRGARIEVVVTASDATHESAPESAYVSVGNRAPELVAVALDPPGEITRGRPLTAVPRASDPDGDAVEFSYLWRLNERELQETGPSLDTSSLKRGDRVQVRVVASDGESESEAIESPPMPVANAAPSITSTPPGFGADGVFRYALESADPDGDRSVRYRLVHGPEGMTVDAMSGVVTWKPSAKGAGQHTVEVEVDDLQGGRGSQIFTLSVAVGEAPKDQVADAGARKAPAKDGAAGNDEPETSDAEPETED